MDAFAMLDLDAISRACQRFGVERLRIFGSALTDRFDPEGSDIDSWWSSPQRTPTRFMTTST